MKHSSIILVLAFLLTVFPASFNAQSSLGFLKGQVWLGSPSEYAPKVTIRIVGKGIKKEITSGNGEYLVNLPEGLYTISTAETFDNYAFKRAKFRIKANQTTYLNLDPPLRISMIVLRIENGRDWCEYVKEPKPIYSRLKLTNNSLGLDVQIRYLERKIKGQVTEYKNALVTYEALSIFADKITLDKKNKIVAEGPNVIVENNGQRDRATWLSLEIKNGKPIIQTAQAGILGLKGNAEFEKGLVKLQIDALRNQPDKTSPNFENTLSFQDTKNNIKFVSKRYQVILETDDEIVLDGTGCLETKETNGKCNSAGFVAKIKDFENPNLESEFSIKISSINNYTFDSKLQRNSIYLLRN